MKKLTALVVSCTMAIALIGVVPVQAEEPEEQYKVGWSLMTTSDAVIAQAISDAQAEADELGIDFLVSDADNDATKQLDAVENFVESGCDAIIIQAIDTAAMSDAAEQAREQGVKVIAYGPGFDNCDVWYENDNTLTGTVIGETAANWINENLGGEAKVCLIGYSMMEVLVERADAIEAALEANCDNVEIVATFDAVDSSTGMSDTESMLAAHPDVNVICSVSDGSAVGAYEAVKAAGYDTDDFGIFGSDLSGVALKYIQDGTCYRGTTDCDNTVCGTVVIDIANDLLTGQEVDDVVVMGVTPVTIDNVSDYESFME